MWNKSCNKKTVLHSFQSLRTGGVLNLLVLVGNTIVFVGSQYDGADIEQWTIGYGWRKNQRAKLNIVGGAISGSNQELYNICNCVITFGIVLTSE